MSYNLVAVFSYTSTQIYKNEGEDITKVKTNTESVLFDDIVMDAWEAVVTERMFNGREYTAMPTHTSITAYPTLSLRK